MESDVKIKTRILAVDDSQITLEFLDTILTAQGFEIKVLLDGKKTLQMVREFTPDIILLDIVMPEISGLEICKQLKAAEDTKNIPILFITASTDADVLQKTFDSGGTDYVSKPIKIIELMIRIRSALSQAMLFKKILNEEKLEGVLELSGAVCHELNQPLQVIAGHVELATMKLDDDDILLNDVIAIKQQVDRMAEITRKLMGITKYEKKRYLTRNIIDIDKASSKENL